MPLIYGKTVMSTQEDLRASLTKYLTKKERFLVTSLCYKFWSTKYVHMDCLIRLIRIIGRFATCCERPVMIHIILVHLRIIG